MSELTKHDVQETISSHLMSLNLKIHAIKRIRDDLMLYEKITPEQALEKLDLVRRGVI